MAAVARILAVVRGAVVNKPMLYEASCANVRANVVMVLHPKKCTMIISRSWRTVVTKIMMKMDIH